MQEEQIIKLLWSQDKKVIDVLYDLYSASLYGIALKIVPSEEIAQDVIQDAFTKVWKSCRKYDPSKGTLFTWLLNITRNTALDHLRQYKRLQVNGHSALDGNVDHYVTEGINPNHIGVKEIVEDLDDKYRTIIELIYFKGYTQSEVQQHLDIPLGTVKSRAKIAMRELRKVFQEQNVTLLVCLLSGW